MLNYCLFCLIIIPRFPNISPRILFWINYGNAFFFIAFSIIWPLNMKIPWKSKMQRKVTPFYVHKSNLPFRHHPPPSPPAPSPATTQPPSPTVPSPAYLIRKLTATQLLTKKNPVKTNSKLSQSIPLPPIPIPRIIVVQPFAEEWRQARNMRRDVVACQTEISCLLLIRPSFINPTFSSNNSSMVVCQAGWMTLESVQIRLTWLSLTAECKRFATDDN